MPYGQIKVDEITFTNAGVDQTISVSGVVASISGNITATGTISGNVIRGGTLVSGATVTGTAGQFGTITGNTAGFTTVTGTTVTGTTAQFTTVTGGTAGFTTITGTTVTGTTANFVTVSGTTVTGNVGNFTTVTGGTVTLTSGVFAAGSATNPSISFTSDPNSGLFSPGADQVAISTNGSGRLFVNGSGNVGIGVSPSYTLDVNGQGRFTNDVLIADGTATRGRIYGDSNGLALRAENSLPIRFLHVGTELARITYDGKLGLGTSSPQTALHITNTGLTINTGSNCGRVYGVTTNKLGFTFSSADGLTVSPDKAQLALINDNTSSRAQFLIGLTHSASFPSYSFIDDPNTGIVGGATAAPDELGINTGGVRALTVDASQRIGIGTSSVRSLFNIASSSNPTITIENTDTTMSVDQSYGRIDWYGNDASVDAAGVRARIDAIDTTGQGATAIVFSNTVASSTTLNERVRITSTGAVGIGTTLPQSILHLAGSSPQLILDPGSGSTDPVSINSWRTNAPIVFKPGDTERVRIDGSGRLLVGTSTNLDSYLYQVDSSGATIASFTRYGADAATVRIGSSRGTQGSRTALNNGDFGGAVQFDGYTGTAFSSLAYIGAACDGQAPANGDSPGRLVFSTTADGASSPTERMRISSNGTIIFVKTAASFDTAGVDILNDGQLRATRTANPSIAINRLTDDGGLIEFYQANTIEGSISVSGTTVSYNGAHLTRWSQLPGGTERTEILRGTVLSNIDEMCGWGEEDNEQLNRMKVSDIEGDPNVSGVFQAWDDDDDTYTDDFYCAMTGDFIIRIAEGVTVQRGDLLMSAGDGTAKPQDDDIIRSKTIAKVTSTHVTCTYDDGSYCVPCVLMAC
jgi:hypothetical protein